MKKILIIEDEKKIRRFLQLELEHEGYTVYTAEDGAEGFEKFEKDYYDLNLFLTLCYQNFQGKKCAEK